MRKFIIAGIATLVLAGAATGAFAAGQSTRLGDDAVATKVADAVNHGAARATRDRDDAVREAVAQTQAADQVDALEQAKSARKAGYTAGYTAGQGDGYADGADATATASENSTSRNTVTTEDGTWDRDSAAYRARCSDLYATWKSSVDESGSAAIQEYGTMLCDQ